MNPTRVFRKLDAMMALMTTSNSPISTAAVFVVAGAWQRVSKELYKMKKALICALLAVAVICCGTALYAQDSMAPGGVGPQHRMAMSPEQRLQRMTKALNLTDDQQQKIKPILESESQQMQTLRQDTSMSQQDKWGKMEQIRQTSTSQITPILTPDQQKKYAEMNTHHGPPPQAGGQMAPQGAPQQ
jgi:Spy/CpxP family protein refolding chaperone